MIKRESNTAPSVRPRLRTAQGDPLFPTSQPLSAFRQARPTLPRALVVTATLQGADFPLGSATSPSIAPHYFLTSNIGGQHELQRQTGRPRNQTIPAVYARSAHRPFRHNAPPPLTFALGPGAGKGPKAQADDFGDRLAEHGRADRSASASRGSHVVSPGQRRQHPNYNA